MTDWHSFANEIELDVLMEMGAPINVLEPVLNGKGTTGKRTTTYKSNMGIAVMGKYDSEFIEKNSTTIKAGDVKFVCRFNNPDFEPVDNKDETVVFGGRKYKVINVDSVNPDGTCTIVYLIQGRRVN